MIRPKSRDAGLCGIDEVGRGPLAGPVTASAVVLPADFDVSILADSKSLSPHRREVAEGLLTESDAAIGLGWVWPEEIDRINIHRASLLAMERALDALHALPGIVLKATHVVVDGKFAPRLALPCEPIIGGDHIVPQIMAASIVAKVRRDRWMVDYARKDSRYGFDRHKGYPTRAHKAALLAHGPSPIHRMTFKGVVSSASGLH